MDPQDVFYVGKMCTDLIINNSNIYLEWAQVVDPMGRIWTVSPLHLYYSRDYRSTSPSGGNHVDGLPPALRWKIFELFIEVYMICRYFSHIEYVLRIHLVNISFIFIKYEPSTV